MLNWVAILFVCAVLICWFLIPKYSFCGRATWGLCKFAPTVTFWLSVRQCQLLISPDNPTALPSFIHKNTTHIKAEAITLRAIGYMGMWRYNSTHFTLGTGWGEWLASRSCRFAPKKKSPLIYWLGGSVGFIAGLDATEKRKIFFPLSELEYRTVSLTA
jgi:hypothetical protein